MVNHKNHPVSLVGSIVHSIVVAFAVGGLMAVGFAIDVFDHPWYYISNYGLLAAAFVGCLVWAAVDARKKREERERRGY